MKVCEYLRLINQSSLIIDLYAFMLIIYKESRLIIKKGTDHDQCPFYDLYIDSAWPYLIHHLLMSFSV